MSAPAETVRTCHECGRPARWHVVRGQGPGKDVRLACQRHLAVICLYLHPDPKRHHELVVTRMEFWAPIPAPHQRVDPEADATAVLNEQARADAEAYRAGQSGGSR